MSALFVIQKDVMQDRQRIIDALNAEDLPYRLSRFGRQTKKRPPFSIATAIPLGSVAFVTKAQRCGWGGVFRPDSLGYDAYEAGWGARMLNFGATRATLGTIAPFGDAKFIRPVADDKSFNGAVVDGSELETWRQHAVDYNGDETNADTPVLVADAIYVSREWRCFIVDGAVVAGTQYYNNGRLHMTEGIGWGSGVTEYATEAVHAWSPARAFVLDIGETSNGLRIVEAGCINCAGFYAADARPVLRALAGLVS